VVFIFIQDWRATLIPTIAIPVSLLGAFIAFPLIGFTINVLSLLGLVLAIGIVVDDAIVVVEAVQVNIEKGMTPKEATIQGHERGDRAGHRHHPGAGGRVHPGGRHGRHHRPALSAVRHHRGRIGGFSSINALTLSPALCGLLLKKQKPIPRAPGAVFQGCSTVFDKSTNAYMLHPHRDPQNRHRPGFIA
jgi:HAE1 family hydrophobic/amphiphilic exporter-1